MPSVEDSGVLLVAPDAMKTEIRDMHAKYCKSLLELLGPGSRFGGGRLDGWHGQVGRADRLIVKWYL